MFHSIILFRNTYLLFSKYHAWRTIFGDLDKMQENTIALVVSSIVRKICIEEASNLSVGGLKKSLIVIFDCNKLYGAQASN